MFLKTNGKPAQLTPVSAGILILAACWALAANAFAQSNVEIELARKTYPEVKIAVLPFQLKSPGADPGDLGAETRSVLENDLAISEFFSPVELSVFAGLAADENAKMSVDYSAWNALGVQWLIKTEYAFDPGGKSFIFIFRLYDVVNERFLMGKRYRGAEGHRRRVAHRFADEVVEQLTGKRGAAESKLAFVSWDGNSKEVFLVDFDGHNPKKLTNERSMALNPAWAPDNQRIVFTSYAANNPDLTMIDLRGNNRKTLLKLPGLNAAPSWSPDGEKIALTLSKDSNAEIYVLNKNMMLERLTRHFNIDTSPTWSPDGEKIAFTSDRSGTAAPQIYVMDSQSGDRKKLKRLTFNSSYNDNPSWSPDGDRIAFTSREGKRFRIKIYDLETSKTHLFTDGAGSQEKPTWSPDGRFIAYTHKENASSQIYIKKVGSKKPPRQLTFLSKGASSPSWSRRSGK